MINQKGLCFFTYHYEEAGEKLHKKNRIGIKPTLLQELL